MMKTEIVKEWCAALRSGEYRQIKGTLHNGEGFCCLGVLADIAMDAYWVPDRNGRDAWKLSPTSNGATMLGYAMLWDKALEQLGLSHSAARLLSDDNDNGHSFAAIADRIEELALAGWPDNPRDE